MDTLQKGDKVEIDRNDGKVIYNLLQSYLDCMYCGLVSTFWHIMNIFRHARVSSTYPCQSVRP